MSSAKKLRFNWYQVKMGFSPFPSSDVDSCINHSNLLKEVLETKIVKRLFPRRITWDSEHHLVISRQLTEEQKTKLSKSYTLHIAGGKDITWPARIKEFANNAGLKLP